MKRLLLFSFYLILFNSARGQVANWLIHPLYDSISIVNGTDAILTDSVGISSIWNFSGEKLITTSDKLFDFKEGLAVSLDRKSSYITDIYDIEGNKISTKGYKTTFNYPYFSCGYLLVKEGKYFKYLYKDGKTDDKKFIKAFPYSNGYTSCTTYLNWEKEKDLCLFLLDTDRNKIKFSFEKKDINNEDIDFISSINDEKIGFIVIKNKIYVFDAFQNVLKPLLYVNGSKKQAKTEDDFLKQEQDSSYSITAKCGKNEIIKIKFNSFMIPVSITKGLNEHVYKTNKEIVKEYNSQLSKKKGNNNKLGIFFKNKELIPAQFDEIKVFFDNKVLLKKNGKYGMIEIYKDANFNFQMNKGDDIAFRHQKFETTLRADFPNIISSNNTEIYVDPKYGCEIDPTSKKNKDTDNGSFVQYNCTLSIPDSLPDKLTEINYPIQITHDGITLIEKNIKVNAWHYKYFVVDIDESQTTLEKNNVSFVFNINAERIANEGVYPTVVNINTDSLLFDIDKMSEIRYKCKIFNLNEGINNITITILEKGCPPAKFPFEIEYSKPMARTRNRAAVKEKVIIKKKEDRQPFVIMD